jgi:hypothetical protein
MNEELQKTLKYLRLWGLLARWDELLAEAQRGRFSHERLLQHVLEAEFRTRSETARLLRRRRTAGTCYADQRGNAVLVLLAGKEQRPVGAELRGTGPRVWRGLAPGTRKDEGFFWIGTLAARDIVLCESAIDAISCYQLDPRRIGISTAGVRANPRWLPALLARGYRVHCGFDTDDAGEEAATRMITSHPLVQRLRPPAHDWNDALTSGQ